MTRHDRLEKIKELAKEWGLDDRQVEILMFNCTQLDNEADSRAYAAGIEAEKWRMKRILGYA